MVKLVIMITGFHIQRSIERTGKPFKEMHCWLDNCMLEPFENLDRYPFQHRVERHTREGLRQIQLKFGTEALIEALEHLKEDGIRLE